MRTAASRALAVIALAIAGAAVARAQDVAALRVSTTPDGLRAGTVFPAGTETLYAVFNYADLENRQVSATLEGRGIAELYTVSDRFTGTGLGSLPISGAMVYKTVTNRLLAESRALQDAAGRAAGSQVGLQEYLEQCLAAVYSMRALLDYLAEVPVSEVAVADAASARQAAAELEDLIDDALRLPATDVAGRQAKADAMKRPAAAAVAAARQLVEGAATVTAAPFAVSPRNLEYTMQLEVEGMPAASVDFVISPGTRIALPLVARHAGIAP